MQIGDLRVPPANRLEKLKGTADMPSEVTMSSMDVPLDIFTSIEREISSETSPVGIDAKKTHIIILHKLQEIDERLRRIEERL